MEDGLEKGENGVGEEDLLSQALKFSYKILSLSFPYVRGTAYKDLKQKA